MKYKTPEEIRIDKIVEDGNVYVRASLEKSKVCSKYHPDGKYHNTKTDCKDCFYNAFTDHELDVHYCIRKTSIDKVWDRITKK